MGVQGENAGAGLDALARDLATGTISRRTALRRFAGAGLTAILPGALFADSAFASCPQSRRCAGTCCPNHAHCVHGKCKCRKGFTKCGKHCRDLQTDPKNCGKCGHRCPAGESCRNGHCKPAPASCTDGVKNGDETDVDCGGSCSPCANGTNCLVNSDCQSGVCSGGTCVAPSCSDAVKNGDETDVDCGGSCSPCANGKGCLQNSDCQSGVCSGGTCAAPVCGNGIIEPGETCDGADLGGQSCQSFGYASGSLACTNACTFDFSGCTAVDCATATPGAACNDGNLCTVGDTCQANVCTGGSPVVCQAQDECHSAGICNPATGQCSNPARPNGTACSGGGTCQNGVCI